MHFTLVGGRQYTLYRNEVDSIVYASGKRDTIFDYGGRITLRQNIPELNTYGLDVMGFAFFCLSQSYERRTKDGLLGLRVPLYLSLRGGGHAGMAIFNRYNLNPFSSGYAITGLHGFSAATGINPKIYLFRSRKARLFLGPEVDIGYSEITAAPLVYNGEYNYPTISTYRCGTLSMLFIFGVSVNPVEQFNMTFHIAAGGGDIFGSNNPIDWKGLGQIGFSMGPNW